MVHVGTRILAPRVSYTEPVAGGPIGERLRQAPTLNPPASIPPDLESAYGLISGIVLGLLMWVGLLLPALYFLL
ncbi:MAG TPA: hypothetical protein VJV04_12480 [Nitrospiraceae bacterium]|nr:hypothetical protein [Nitrospiraceae bacterium]